MILSRFIQLMTCAGGIACFCWALFDSRFRQADGALKGEFCLPVAAGLAFIIVGCTIKRRFRESAGWFALALIGQAVALQMIEAGSSIRYQHYQTWGRLLTWPSVIYLVALIIQSVLVLAGLKSRWPQISGWLRDNFKVWQLIAVAVTILLPSAAVSRDVKIFLMELPFAAGIQIINLGNIVLIAMTLPRESLNWMKEKVDGWVGTKGAAASGASRYAGRSELLGALWVMILAGMLSYFAYERHPHIPDEVVYIYHARYLAAGMLTMPPPPAPDAINVDLMHYESDRWYCPVPPGWPLMLALGVLIGVPWLVNPVLAGLNVLLAYAFIREIYHPRAARLTAALLCVSPWHVFMAMNFMTHTFTLTGALLAALGLAWARRTGKARWGLLSGMSTGLVSLIRPLEGFVLVGLLALWAIGIGGKRLKIPALAALILGTVAVGGLVLPYNKILTGSPTKFPIMAYTDKYYGPNKNAMGFGPDRGLGWELDPFPGHGLRDALVNNELNTFSVNIELFGWSTGSLFIIACLLFSGSILSTTLGRSDYLMLAVIIAIFVAHIFYWYSGGPDFGARYWFLMLIPCLALTARGIEFLQSKFVTGNQDAGDGERVMALVLSLCLLTLVNYFPWRAIDKYHNYLRMRPDVRRLDKEHNFGKSLVLIKGNRHPDYASAAVYNPLDLRADAPIYAWDRDAKTRKQALTAYPDRQVWIIDGPTMTHGGFQVVEGPLPAQKLIAEQTAQETPQQEAP
jgi:4-amino-4-deoxy-L-arabinose transferase-like glycosyltransferase